MQPARPPRNTRSNRRARTRWTTAWAAAGSLLVTLLWASDASAQTGGCCFADGQCRDYTSETCTSQAGTPQAVGSSCANLQCPQPDLPCCYPSGGCAMVKAAACQIAGGQSSPFGQTCVSTRCPQPATACCFSDGSCRDVGAGLPLGGAAAECSSLSGSPGTTGSTCAVMQCPQPPVACCFPEGRCSNLSPGMCRAQGGSPGERGSACFDTVCAQPRVACCAADGSCDMVTAFECNRDGGLAGAYGSNCDTFACAEPPRGSLSGNVWHDLNRNGIREDEEPGLAGVQLVVSGGGDVRRPVAGDDGAWHAADLRGGEYRITIDHATDPVLSARAFQPAPSGADPGPARASIGSPAVVQVAAGEERREVNFGFLLICNDVDADLDGICDDIDGCLDADGDGYGEGPECLGPDCDDTLVFCNVDCERDVSGGDGNGVPDCLETACIDADGDGYGIGPACIAADCDDGEFECTIAPHCEDCDADGVPNCLDDDDDNDGLPDKLEMRYGSDPCDPDSDADGRNDGTEVHVDFTDPSVEDDVPGIENDVAEDAGCQGGAPLTAVWMLMLVGLVNAWRRRAH